MTQNLFIKVLIEIIKETETLMVLNILSHNLEDKELNNNIIFIKSKFFCVSKDSDKIVHMAYIVKPMTNFSSKSELFLESMLSCQINIECVAKFCSNHTKFNYGELCTEEFTFKMIKCKFSLECQSDFKLTADNSSLQFENYV